MNPGTFQTRADLALSVPAGGLMIELGVARGDFAVALLMRNPEAEYLGIDRYADHHGREEFRYAIDQIEGLGGVLIRSTFAQAAPMCLDSDADLIYIDGYAHTGQESGQTLRDWWPKLKPGGIFAGHDYCPKWQPTMDAVDAFVDEHGLELNLIREDGTYPSWWVRKPLPVAQDAPSVPRLVRVCPACGSRPKYSMVLRSEWIVCPNGCLKTFVRGGATPEWLENQWNLNCNMALAADAADTPFDEYFDANPKIADA